MKHRTLKTYAAHAAALITATLTIPVAIHAELLARVCGDTICVPTGGALLAVIVLLASKLPREVPPA